MLPTAVIYPCPCQAEGSQGLFDLPALRAAAVVDLSSLILRLGGPYRYSTVCSRLATAVLQL
jgi:hypothetical protein